MEPGARLSLDEATWLQPLPDQAAAEPDEYVVLLVEGYVAFADGEVARMWSQEDDLELFEGIVRVPVEVMQARPAAPGRERQMWAQQAYRDFIAGQVRQLREPSAMAPLPAASSR